MKNRTKISRKGFNFNIEHYTTVRFYFDTTDILAVRTRDIDLISLKRLAKLMTKPKKKWFGNVAYRTENNGFAFIHLSDVKKIEFK